MNFVLLTNINTKNLDLFDMKAIRSNKLLNLKNA